MNEADDFKESNRRLAEAFQHRLDELLDELIDIEDQRGATIDHDRSHRIGEWQRLEMLARWPGGEEFLTENESRLLQESFKFQTKTGQPNLDPENLAALKEWAESSDQERWIAFCFNVWARITGGAATEEESLYLFAIVNQVLGFLPYAPNKVSDISEQVSFAKKGAEALHAKKGHREKRMKIRAAWASGKYSSRDICAEQECAAIGMSFATARKALRGTPDPVT